MLAGLIRYFDRPCACGFRIIMFLIARRPSLTTALRIRDRMGDNLVLRRVALALLLLLDHYCVGAHLARSLIYELQRVVCFER
jgi:hypothetical protein